jgi:hypothetical protein
MQSSCPASAKIYPWRTFVEPSKAFAGLQRLCLAHAEDCDCYFVVDIYEPSEIESAELELVCAVMQHRSGLTLAAIRRGGDDRRMGDLLRQLTPSLRSTQLIHQGKEVHERRCTSIAQPGRKF